MILKNRELKTELKKSALERAKNFSWEKTAKLTVDGIKNVLYNKIKIDN